MDLITSFLSNPVVSLTGYVLSFVASITAISENIGKSKAREEVRNLQIQITNLQSNTKNENNINQGKRSQYFQDNSGPVTIDNRG